MTNAISGLMWSQTKNKTTADLHYTAPLSKGKDAPEQSMIM